MASFQPLSVLFYREGFDWRQLATVSDVASQTELVNYIISLGAARSGDWYRFPDDADETLHQAIAKAHDLGGKVYDLRYRIIP
jgi:hypothetical protein